MDLEGQSCWHLRYVEPHRALCDITMGDHAATPTPTTPTAVWR
jgi:hypothetical protein